jgi:hypothetical protein
VVAGLAAERARLRDGRRQWRPAGGSAPRDAGLAVNFAGSVALFLVDALETRGDAA